MVRTIRSLPVLVLACVCACDRTVPHTPPPPLELPGCYQLTYREWGVPPRADGKSLGGARAPIAIELLRAPPFQEFTEPGDTSIHAVLWVVSDTDRHSLVGHWSTKQGDTLSLEFPFMPGLYGMWGAFLRDADSVVGKVGTYSDALGAEQGESRVTGRRVTCRFPEVVPLERFNGDTGSAADKAARVLIEAERHPGR